MSGQPVPEQGRLLTAEELPQLADHLDQSIGVVVAGGDVEAELGAATAHAIASAAAIEAFFQLNGCVNVGG
jgi:hypothetical protein